MDFIHNGRAHGSVAAMLMEANFDPRVLRPWAGKDGRNYIACNGKDGKSQAVVTNTVATLRKEEWVQLDMAVVTAARARLKAVADIRGAGLQYSIPNGMAKTVLQTENQSDAGNAVVSMDGMRESTADRVTFDLTSLPLPITHSDFYFSARQVATSRNMGAPIDVTGAEQAGRRVAESIEQLLLGVSASYTYAGGTIYGLTNFTNRNTKTMTAPTATGWTAAQTVADVLDMKTKSQNDFHYGPWMLYVSTTWDPYLDADYSTIKGDNTLRERLKKIEGIQDVRTLDYLPAKTMVLVQMTQDVIRMINGMDVTTIQWESHGGMRLNFKVMAILVPQVRSDFNGNCGVVHGTHA